MPPPSEPDTLTDRIASCVALADDLDLPAVAALLEQARVVAEQAERCER